MKSGNIGTGGFGKAKHRYFAQKKEDTYELGTVDGLLQNK